MIQPLISSSWSMMFQVRKLIFRGAWAIAGIGNEAAATAAPDMRICRLLSMLFLP